jgi:GLPGLI family protein
MKNWILLNALFFVSGNINAQYFNYLSGNENLSKYSVADSAYLKCSYRLSYLKDSLKPNQQSNDLQILLVGKTISNYYSQYALDYNHFIAEYLKKEPDSYPNIKEKGAWNYQLLKNYPSGKETVADIAPMLGGNFIYEEDLPVLDWKISDEKQKILSYTCQKAITSFRGRDYIAWFAPDIPIPNGPWKFGGLPGLILKLSDTKNYFVYECQGLERLTVKEPIKFFKIEYTKLTRNELNKLYLRFHDDMARYMEPFGVSVSTADGLDRLKIPYNPIELE